MLRNLWYQLHWLIGISFGVVLAVVGVTGGILSFEQPIIKALSHGVMTVVAPGNSLPLAPDALVAAIHRQAPGKSIASLGFSPARNDAVAVSFAYTDGRGNTVYANPYTGALLGEAHGRGFMQKVRSLHRWVLLDIKTGRPMVGIATALLVMLCLSGLYLRWPRRMANWRTWLTFNFRQKGRSFLWHMHAVLGTWALLLYLLAALTGLWWSFGWYRSGVYQLAGVEQPQRRDTPRAESKPGSRAATPDLHLDGVWQTFLATVGHDGYQGARLSMPKSATGNVDISYLPTDAPHPRASNSMVIDAVTDRVVKHDRYAGRRAGEKFIASIFPLHSGEFFGKPGLVAMMVASLGMPMFAITGWMLYLDRRRKRKAGKALRRELAPAITDREAVLVAYASQTGSAERYAWMSAGHLQAACIPVTVKALGSMRPGEFGKFSHALFAIASFGDGQAPDNARSFARNMPVEHPALAHLRFGLLALGDRTYENFCGFGKSVGAWLHARGAQPLFDDVLVHQDDPAAVDVWRLQLAKLTGHAARWHEAPFHAWRLRKRRIANPGSVGGRIGHLELTPGDAIVPHWQAGDLVEIVVAHANGRDVTRDYSIASLPEDGAIHLLVREARHADGRLGAGSALLLEALGAGEKLPLRIRSNTGFHMPSTDAPVILVGNGTGIAGLRSHLRAREMQGHHRNWLVFGERNREHDFLFREDVERWHANGHLQRLDLAFSRDQPHKVYVQDCLRRYADELRRWIDTGAILCICGSTKGMAPGVEAALIEVVGNDGFEALTAGGRHLRDVY